VTSWPGNPKLLVVVERGSKRVTLWDLDALDNGSSTIVEINEAFVPTAPAGEFVGVTGFAFHPMFLDADGGDQRFVYVRYNRVATVEAGSTTTVRTFVKRFEIAPGKTSVTDASETTVYTWPTVQTGHGSGTLQFDRRPNLGTFRLFVPMPDDALANTGAAGVCCEAAKAQGLPTSSDIGRLLSIDVIATGFPVTVEAQGFRNPFGFSVDRGATSNGFGRGDVWIGDTGHTFTGSIMRVLPGTVSVDNYGWPWREVNGGALWGSQPQTRLADGSANPTLYSAAPNPLCAEPPTPPTYTQPLLGFSDADEYMPSVRDAIIGGVTYRGAHVPALTNRYVFATFGVGQPPRIYHTSPTIAGQPQNISGTTGTSNWPFGSGIHALGDDWSGANLYVVRVDPSTSAIPDGSIWRIDP